MTSYLGSCFDFLKIMDCDLEFEAKRIFFIHSIDLARLFDERNRNAASRTRCHAGRTMAQEQTKKSWKRTRVSVVSTQANKV